MKSEDIQQMIAKLRADLIEHRAFCKKMCEKFLTTAEDYVELVDLIDRIAESTHKCKNTKHFMVAALARLGYLELACEDDQEKWMEVSEN